MRQYLPLSDFVGTLDFRAPQKCSQLQTGIMFSNRFGSRPQPWNGQVPGTDTHLGLLGGVELYSGVVQFGDGDGARQARDPRAAAPRGQHVVVGHSIVGRHHGALLPAGAGGAAALLAIHAERLLQSAHRGLLHDCTHLASVNGA